MGCDSLSLPRNVALACLALAGCFFGPAASAEADKTSAEVEDTSAEIGETSAEEKKTSVELRFVLNAPSARWSVVDERDGINAFHSKRSLYFGPGIGVRVFPRQPHHGVIVDMQYSFDTDVDSINVDVGSWRTDFVLARAGYGYRFIKHANEKMAWAFTLHGSLSTGASINRRRPKIAIRRVGGGAAASAACAKEDSERLPFGLSASQIMRLPFQRFTC